MYNPQLKTFIQVANDGSFTQASEKLYITPASVMKQINSLEEHIGVTLFIRSNQGITLTSAGKAFYKEAIRMIQISDKAVSKVREIAGQHKYILRIGTSLLNPCHTFFRLWKTLNKNNSEYQFKIVTFEDNHANILSTIENLGKEIDFFVGTCGSRSWLARCNFFPLGNHYLSIAVPHGHLLEDFKTIDFSDLYGNTLLMSRRGDSEFIDKFRDMLEIAHPQIHIQDTDYYYDIDVFNECEQAGSVLLTLDTWEEVHPSLNTIPLKEKFANPYGIIYSQNCTDEMENFIKLIKHLTNYK